MQCFQTVIKPSVKLAGIGAVLFLTGCGMGMDDASDQTRSFTSNGEQIYYTGRSQTGCDHLSKWNNARSDAPCFPCQLSWKWSHGAKVYPRFWIFAPPLTGQALFEEHDDHQRYDKENLKRAIRKGIDPAGRELNYAMPRWQMSKEDIDDLVNFLMTGINGQKTAH